MTAPKGTTALRRPRADSKEEAVKTFMAAHSQIAPPSNAEYSDHEKEVFDEVISEFAKVDWSPHSIRLAWMLSQAMCRLEEDSKLLKDEGSCIDNARGNPVQNPLLGAVGQATSQVMQLRRTLALHANAGTSKADIAKRTAIRREQEADAPEDDENLIGGYSGHA